MEVLALSPALRRHLAGPGPIVALTGAGVSAESGLSTFRGPGGLWEGRDPASLATPEAFSRDPEMVWRFYAWRRARAAEAVPNPAHEAMQAPAQNWRREMGAVVSDMIRVLIPGGESPL